MKLANLPVILPIVLSVLVLTESSVVTRTKRRPMSDRIPRGCMSLERAFIDCQNYIPIGSHMAFAVSPLRLDIYKTCVDLKRFRECMGEREIACSGVASVKAQLSFIVQVMNYTCSPLGQQNVDEMINSRCNTRSRSILQEIWMKIGECTTDDGRPFEYVADRNRCEVLEYMEICLIETLDRSCGTAAAKFTKEVLRLLNTTPGAFYAMFRINC